jgi:hypothetical protein
MATMATPVAGFAAEQPADLSDRGVQERLSPAARVGFFRLATQWKLRDLDARQLLGGVSHGAYYQLKAGGTKRLDQDRLTRISLLLGIFKALNILYSGKLADAWVMLPNANAMFRGETPLHYMVRTGLPGMMRVRQLLDARRGAL